MIKPRNVKSILLMAFVGTLLIALVDPIAANNMAQKNMKNSSSDKQTNMMPYMMIGKQSDNKTNESMMGMTEKNGYVVALDGLSCTDLWLEKAIKLHDVHLKDPSTATEKSQKEMMNQMIHAQQCISQMRMMLAAQQSTKGEKMNAGVRIAADERLTCALLWLEKAEKLYDVHLKDPSTATEKSQKEIMNQMIHAQQCISQIKMMLTANQSI